MANTDIGALANAWAATMKTINKWLDGTKGRRTTKALLNAKRGLGRAVTLYPDLAKDKTFKKYNNNFLTNTFSDK